MNIRRQTIANLKAAKKLIYKKLYMIVCQLLSFDNIAQIGTHQMRHKIPKIINTQWIRTQLLCGRAKR